MKKFIFIISAALFTMSCQKQLSFDEKCQKEAQEQTKKICPRPITEGITLDSIVYTIPTHSLSYCYTMTDPFDNQEAIDAGKEKFREALRNQVINSLDLKRYKDKGITFRYIYYSGSKKNKMLEVAYTKEDYQK